MDEYCLFVIVGHECGGLEKAHGRGGVTEADGVPKANGSLLGVDSGVVVGEISGELNPESEVIGEGVVNPEFAILEHDCGVSNKAKRRAEFKVFGRDVRGEARVCVHDAGNGDSWAAINGKVTSPAMRWRMNIGT